MTPDSSNPVTADFSYSPNLYLHEATPNRIVAIGEVLWDIFPHDTRLGGAPLNFAVHARKLSHPVSLVSALGNDDLGRQAAEQIASLDIDVTFLRVGVPCPTGTATVNLAPQATSPFTIHRPAAYDAMSFTNGDLVRLKQKQPAWLYYGTLFASSVSGRAVLNCVLDGLDNTVKFYDVNLRPPYDSPELVAQLLERADVVKLNEEELHRVHKFTGLAGSTETFCREGSARFGWKAVAVTLGSRGCALFAGNLYVEERGLPVDVADTVGAGDAFAAAFVHGLSFGWPLREIAKFANRVGALVASRHGAIPDWTIEEAVRL